MAVKRHIKWIFERKIAKVIIRYVSIILLALFGLLLAYITGQI